MAVPFALMATGTAIQIAGQVFSNFAQSRAEAENARFYEEQARYAEFSARRAESIAEYDYTNKVGAQISAYAAGGVDVSGSARITNAGTIKNMLDEIFAIRKKGEIESKLARLRGGEASSRSDMLSSPGFNLLQAGTTFLTNYTASGGFGKGFPDWMTPDAPTPLGTTYKYFSSQPSDVAGTLNVLQPYGFQPTDVYGLRL